jgi:hypothetical protein
MLNGIPSSIVAILAGMVGLNSITSGVFEGILVAMTGVTGIAVAGFVTTIGEAIICG